MFNRFPARTAKMLTLVFLLSFFMVMASGAAVRAQSESDANLPPDLVLLCIEPIAIAPNTPTSTAEAGVRPAYLMGFRETELVGFVMPQDAMITVYAAAEMPVAVGIDHILPDALSGGYRAINQVGTLNVTTNFPTERPCAAEYEEVSDDLWATPSFPVSPNQAITIQVAGDGNPHLAEFLGSVAFHFIDVPGFSYLQVIQLSSSYIDLTFPFLTTDTEFILIANKSVSIRKSFSIQEPNFSSQAVGDERSIFMDVIIRLEPPLNLYAVMEQGAFHIYPKIGMWDVYPTGGLLRLELASSPASRTPIFEVGQQVITLDGANIRAKIFSRDVNRQGEIIGQIESTTPREVIGIDENGQLIVRNQTATDGIVQAWLIEVVPE